MTIFILFCFQIIFSWIQKSLLQSSAKFHFHSRHVLVCLSVLRTFALSCLHLRVVIVFLLWFGGAAPVKRGRLFPLPQSLRLCSVLRSLIVRLAPRFAKFFPHRYFLAVVSDISPFSSFFSLSICFFICPVFRCHLKATLLVFFLLNVMNTLEGSLLSRRIVPCPFFYCYLFYCHKKFAFRISYLKVEFHSSFFVVEIWIFAFWFFRIIILGYFEKQIYINFWRHPKLSRCLVVNEWFVSFCNY